MVLDEKREDQIKKKKKYEFNEERATKPYVKQVRLRRSRWGERSLKGCADCWAHDDTYI